MNMKFDVEKVKPDENEAVPGRSDGGFLDDKNEPLAYEI